MFRFFAIQRAYGVSRFVTFCVYKTKAAHLLPVVHSRRLHNSDEPLWKDDRHSRRDEPEDTDKIDLNKWKTVMRSQVAGVKQHTGHKDEPIDDDEQLRNPGSETQSSLLEATRELVAMWREAGKLVPEEMTDQEVQTLSELSTKSARKKYLKYLAIREGFKKARKEKQQKKKDEREASMEQRRAQDDEDDQRRPEPKNTFLLQFWDRSLDKVLAWRNAQAMMFDQPLVFDMSYESNMARREIENTVSQLMEVEGWNRRAKEPFHLHFCNLQPGGAYEKELLKRYGAETWNRLLVTSTNLPHVDVFPREQLVYLTADSPNVLRAFDHSKVYIIGALVDRSIQSGLSLANAKRLKLATARLPLDDFLHWEIGAKNLTLDQMMRIMISLKATGKWEEALKFVPQRKHDGFYQQKVEKETNSGRTRDVMSSKGDRTFKNESQSLNWTPKPSGFKSREKMVGVAGSTRVRTSFKNSMKKTDGVGKNKMWWDDE